MNDTAKNRAEFATILAGLRCAFPSAKPLDEAEINASWLGLSDLEISAIKHAAARAIRECKFPPTVAELRAFAGVLPADQRAVIAWGFVRRADRYFRSQHQFRLDCPLTHAAVANMGIARFVRDDRCSEATLRREFERVFVLLFQSGTVDPESLPPLSGTGYRRQESDAAGRSIPVAKTGLPWVGQPCLAAPSGHQQARQLRLANQ